MQLDIQAVGAIVGIAVPVFGAVFWFGRLEGRVSELNRELTDLKEQQNKHELKLEKQSEKFAALDNKMTKVDTGVDTVQKQLSVVFGKLDKMTEALLAHINQTPPAP